jgi:hypothetical protein
LIFDSEMRHVVAEQRADEQEEAEA